MPARSQHTHRVTVSRLTGRVTAGGRWVCRVTPRKNRLAEMAERALWRRGWLTVESLVSDEVTGNLTGRAERIGGRTWAA